VSAVRRRKLIDLLEARDPPVEDPEAALAELRVTVDGAVVANATSMVRPDARIVVRPPKVPQGVRKLGAALDRFGIEPAGCRALDLGACTGGFTLALLERGAVQVAAVDVGFGQLLGSLQQDPRVRNLERTNVAEVTPELLGGNPELVVVDITKLSLREVVHQLVANDVPADGTELVGLVKPMFELGWGQLPTTDEDLERALQLAVEGIAAEGWEVLDTMPSPVRGHRGAVEYFVHARWPGATLAG
jgi:23S rRNA (cytidine1920-2'-O)/16S rRNA (cytidine1409-2'-O)-methyltransferase